MSTCRPCDEVRCVVQRDTTLYSLAGLPDRQPPEVPPTPAEIGNDQVSYTTSCVSGQRLIYTGTLPSWITLGTFLNRVYGAANTFFRTTKTAANAAAQAALDSWVAASLSSTVLKCFGFDETDMWGWWKADAITGYSDGDRLSTWVDSSPYGNHMTQAAAGSQPTYRTAQLNGLPVVNFRDNPNVYFEVPWFYPTFTEGEIYFIIKSPYPPPTTSGGGFMSIGSFADIDNYNESGNRILSSFGRDQRYDTVSVGAALASWASVVISALPGIGTGLNAIKFYINGVLNAGNPLLASNPGWAPVSKSWMGRSVSGGTPTQNYFWGDMAEIIFFSKIKSTADRTMILDYFSTKYGV